VNALLQGKHPLDQAQVKAGVAEGTIQNANYTDPRKNRRYCLTDFQRLHRFFKNDVLGGGGRHRRYA
jgi:hypothetical protein